MTVANHVTRSPPSAISSRLSQTIRHHVPSQRHTPNCMISLSIMPLYPATSRHIPVYQSICPPTVKPGDVVIIRYEGPRGGPGMQEMLYPTSYLKSKGLGK